jgi:glycosyltransferase involved in cell wall biosynthesis
MINLHVYPSPFTHESRILRETAVLAQRTRFERIVMVGTAAPGLPATERLDGVREIHRVPRAPGEGLVGKSLATMAWSRAVLEAYSAQPLACVNCHSLPVLPLCVRLARRTGAKLVYDAHELETETNGLGGLRQLGSKLVERALIGRADAVIVVGDAIADWYARAYPIPRPAVVLNCPAGSVSVRTDRLRERLALPPDQRIFLCQGILGSGRGIELLCEAWDLLRPPRPALVFMGDGPLAGHVEAAAGRNPDVRRIAAVPPAEVLAYTASADVGLCLVQPTCLSYSLCMPNKLFEYLHAGLPVLVSNLPELGRLVREAGLGHVVPDATPQALAATVAAMDSGDLADFAPAVRAAAAKYNWQAQADLLAALYDRLGFGRNAAVETAGRVAAC